MDRYSERFFKLVIGSPKLVVGLVFIIVILLSSGLPRLQISNDFRVYLSKSNPQLQAFEVFEDNYVKSDSATIVITAKNNDVFTPQGLSLLKDLTAEAWLVDYVYRVDSPVNFIVTRANGDEIDSGPLIDAESELNEASVAEIKRQASKEKRLIKSLLAPDLKVAIIFLTLNLPESEKNAAIAVTKQLESLAASYQKKSSEFDIAIGGSTTFNTTLARAVAHDMSTLLPLSYLIIFTGLFFFLRSLVGTFAIFVLISICLLSTFGFFGWFSNELTPIAGFAPSVLLSIMVADSVHILMTYYHHLREGNSKQQAIINSLKLNFMPVLITSVTTIIGFLSLNFSASPPYQDLGNMVAFGVLLALFFSVFFLPALLMLLPVGKLKKNWVAKWHRPFADFVIRRRRALLIFSTAITLLLITFIPNNKMSDNWANYFDDSFELVQLVNRLDGYMTGINALDYSLKPVEGKTIFSPEYLTQVDQFKDWFLAQPKTVKVKSLTDLMKDLNQVMHGDNPDWFKVPDSAELAAQYLLFYEIGLPQGLGLNNLVTIHKDASRLTASITNAGSDELLRIDERAQRWLADNAPAIQATQATGLGVVFAHIAQRNIISLLKGTLIALIGISIVLMLVLRSFKYGLISLIPNIIPAALAYGFWGMTYGYVDISLSIVACSTLGIVVDDTVHFLHKYIRARRQGMDTSDSIRDSFSRVGLALITTSTVLASGFLILTLSSMNTSATIGLLMAITLIFALLVDFLLLPPLLYYLDKTSSSKASRVTKPSDETSLKGEA